MTHITRTFFPPEQATPSQNSATRWNSLPQTSSRSGTKNPPTPLSQPPCYCAWASGHRNSSSPSSICQTLLQKQRQKAGKISLVPTITMPPVKLLLHPISLQMMTMCVSCFSFVAGIYAIPFAIIWFSTASGGSSTPTRNNLPLTSWYC